MELFTPRLREKECQYSIHNNNRFINPPPQKKKCKFSIYNDN